MMRGFLLLFLFLGISIPGRGANASIPPLDVINKEGKLCITDGSSLYTFLKDGTFSMEPLGISGRTIDGKWKQQVSGVSVLQAVVDGQWGWVNGLSSLNDFRTMTIWVYPLSGEKEAVGYQKTSVYKCYFVIEELKKKT